MTGAAFLATLRAPDAHPSKRRLVAILDAVFPTAGERDSWYVSALLGAVDDLIKDPHAPASWLSQKERLAVLAAAERIGEGCLYRWAGVASRADSPSVAELEADGWTVEHIDPRYGTRLMKKAIEP
jgi:hypothetical protein